MGSIGADGVTRSAGVAIEELLDLLRRPGWMADAACKEHPELSWFVERGQTLEAEAAKAVCADCLVRVECLEYANAHEENGWRYGLWGGRSPNERNQAARAAKTAAA